MTTIKRLFNLKLAGALLAFVFIVSLIGANQTQVAAAGTGPCDIYASGGTPCVAAHSTVRSLYGSFSGSLYQVKRASDGATANIGVLSAGGAANGAAQDSFCAGTSCTITIIYDQSGRGNHLTPAPAGGVCGADSPADAKAQPLTIGGNNVYGVQISPHIGYRRNNTSGIATGDQPEGMYAVLDATRYNTGCCFDYGNAETNNLDTGNGHMETIYFGNSTYWGSGSGNGPWIMADLENGLFSGINAGYNSNDPSITGMTYVTAIVKGEPNHWAIRGGNAQSGGLSTYYDGARPNVSGYNPMHKEGAIILGIGGDNSCSAIGSFFEGAITSGYPSTATENSVQSNIVAAGYSGSGAGGGSNCGGTGGSGTYYDIVSRNSGKVLDVQNSPVGNNCDGANVGQYDSNGGAWQKWKLVNSVSGYFTIVSQNSGKCLDVQQPNTSAGANVGIWTCNGNAWQDWQLVSVGSGYYNIKSRNSNLCLDVAGASQANGANVEQWTCNGGTNQQWSLPGYGGGGGPTATPAPTATQGGGSFPVAGTQYRIINQNSGKVADVENCSTANGGNVRQWSDLGNNCQKFTFTSMGSGYYRIQNVNSGKCLDDWAWSTADGANIAQYTCGSGNNQQWSITSAGGGYYTLTNRNSGKVLDVSNCGTADGTNIQQWSSLNNSCQHFQITP